MTTLSALTHNATAWSALLLTVGAFGFTPGFVLRILVLGYERDDPRRKELVAELYTVPRWKRLLWIAEQLETVLFEGFAPRAKRALARKKDLPDETIGDTASENETVPRANRLSISEMDILCTAFLRLPGIREQSSRQLYIDALDSQLPAPLSAIRYIDPQHDVWSLLQTCQDLPGGIVRLSAIVRAFHRGHQDMIELDALIESLFTEDIPPATQV